MPFALSSNRSSTNFHRIDDCRKANCRLKDVHYKRTEKGAQRRMIPLTLEQCIARGLIYPCDTCYTDKLERTDLEMKIKDIQGELKKRFATSRPPKSTAPAL
ncbi:MAG: hypothetical protein A3B23_03480 [Candidatus Colwellbacteria bacterium RIFCSPLOWO2_01_FULL_48_10]|uniref:Uncharacterized protein n=2 Tax=Bacteria candidate phyla TaxID=1783234 RepID=A0A1F5P3T7_9BACT|nr:MAG: hypothetical protein A2846_04500 [Candidatus Doudnabacteria bacterium RIFCSPHIGHO2_01_FULL_49_9]OGY59251.1 MAG: hypothetical protein A3B23_03480 [Candidatus Colwellbacteria bacterium RIFCSPLOWO2_01_FULL_48_10]